jgi:beta-phosphoglucomutase
MKGRKQREFEGAIFDLDGVVVDTVPLHFKAWKRMFSEYGKRFTFQDYKEKVDGIPRIDGGRAILKDLSDEELVKATDRKQGYFLKYLKKGKIKVFRMAIRLIKELRGKGIKVAVISSSKNSPYILKKTGIIKLLDTEVNGNDITKGKPHPQIFLIAAKRMGIRPQNCVVFEDAVLGVEAAKRAGMLCVGVDRHNDPQRLKAADMVINNFRGMNYDKIKALFLKGEV